MRSLVIGILVSVLAVATRAEDTMLTRLKLDLSLADPSIRLNVLETLASNASISDVSTAAPLVLPLLKDPDPAVRMQAAATLAKIGGSSPQVLKRLRDASSDPDAFVSEKVIVALAKNGMSDEPSVKAVAVGLEKLDEGRITQILDAIAEHERSSYDADLSELVSVVVRIGNARCCSARTAALNALAALAPKKVEKTSSSETEDESLNETNPAVTTLIANALREKRQDVIAAATTAAEKWYADALAPDQIYTALIELTRSAQNDTRYDAISVLGKIGRDEESEQALITSLRDHDHTNRRLAVEGLAKRPSRGALAAMIELIDDQSAPVRTAVAKTLQSWGADAHSAAPALARLLRDRSDMVRTAAAEALSDIKSTDSEVVTAVIKASADSHRDVRAAVVKALGTAIAAAADDPDVEPGLVTAAQARLADEEDDIRRDIADHISAAAPRVKVILPVLREMAKADDAKIQLNAVTGLAKFGRDAKVATPELIPLLSSDDGDVRAGAAKTLARARNVPPAAIAPLITSIQADHGCGVAFAIDALSYAGGDIQQAFPAIVTALTSRDYYCTDEETRLVRALARMPAAIDAQLLDEVHDYPAEDPRRSLLDFGPSRKGRIMSLIEEVRRERTPAKLTLLKPDGSQTIVDIGADDVYIAVATWCPVFTEAPRRTASARNCRTAAEIKDSLCSGTGVDKCARSSNRGGAGRTS